MNRITATIGSLFFLLVAPGVVAGLVPWWITGWQGDSPRAAAVAGALLVAAGAAVLLHAFFEFAWHGLGTPAPAAPTERLVVRGPYRFVRNPMYVAVEAVVLGQVLLFASAALAVYLVLVALTMAAFVRAYEEPTLSETYGAEYDEFRAAVPRWLPRPTPWHQPVA